MNNPLTKLVEWAEGEISRGRKIVLFSVIFSFIIMTFIMMVASFFGLPLNEFKWYYGTFAVVAGSAIGFYTGTTPKKLEDIVDKVSKEKSE